MNFAFSWWMKLTQLQQIDVKIYDTGEFSVAKRKQQPNKKNKNISF